MTLFAGSAVLGACRLGDDVVIGAGALVVDTDIPPQSSVFGARRELTIKPRTSAPVNSPFVGL